MYVVTVASFNLWHVIHSLLPPQFPQEKPAVSVFPPVGHHLVDSNNGTMVTSPLITNVSFYYCFITSVECIFLHCIWIIRFSAQVFIVQLDKVSFSFISLSVVYYRICWIVFILFWLSAYFPSLHEVRNAFRFRKSNPEFTRWILEKSSCLDVRQHRLSIVSSILSSTSITWIFKDADSNLYN